MANPQARAIFDAIQLSHLPAPYNQAITKFYYPAHYTGSDMENATGMLPPVQELAPFPVVIFLPGMNIEPAVYRWLATSLAQQGIATLSFQFIAEEMPGYVSSSPGINMNALKPESYGTQPSSTVLAALINYLEQQQTKGPLANCLDLNHIVIGGHSAGGMMALLNANPDWFPCVKGCFSYAAHSCVATALGWPENTYLPLANKVPLLLMAGTHDGCIANSSSRYEANTNSTPFSRVQTTFDQSVGEQGGNNVFALFDGANHFSMAEPMDTSTGRSFIDMDSGAEHAEIRALMAQVIGQFVKDTAPQSAVDLQRTVALLKHPLVAQLQKK